ncbi:MAG: catalase [Phycisphaerales bacterium]|nr:catalase [Phycisphaerales bacterium]
MTNPRPPQGRTDSAKNRDLETDRERSDGERLTTNQGVRVSHTDDSLKAGERGPTLMEDFHLREKLMHFDHERIPERVVHARGSGAHGVFRSYQDHSELTRAAFLRDPAAETPVFVRFSTVVGFRGSADTVRDVRGFAVKFYTSEGVYDLVGNNIPIFFIQDGIKFPDLVHSIKPEPHHEMPQASAAHDTFWDFISLTPESMHMILWALSDRAVPRSYAEMEGFGVHTFRFVNESGLARFVKLHLKPMKAMTALVWDEAQKIAGKDPDFNRRDLWNAIERGDFPEYELGVQVVEEADEMAFDFDLLDPTKIIPEELAPVRPLGRLTLNRNPDNFFAETEQAAFHPGHVVPGIDFTNDPLLQARLFSYLDTQITRLGGPNFAEIPINRPTCPVHNNQRDGFMRQAINVGRTAYSPNSLGRGCPMLTPSGMGGYAHFMERVDGRKIRERSASFQDHYSQAALFFRSLSEPERRRLIDAGRFELGKVRSMEVRTRMIGHFAHIDLGLARAVAAAVGVEPPRSAPPPPSAPKGVRFSARDLRRSDALSFDGEANRRKRTARGARIAALIAEGFSADDLEALRKAAEREGAEVVTVAATQSPLKSGSGGEATADESFLTTSSVVFDAVFVPGGGAAAKSLAADSDALRFVNEAFRHFKSVGAADEGVDVLHRTSIRGVRVADPGAGALADAGVVTSRAGARGDLLDVFFEAVTQRRHWDRPPHGATPA